jgi:hypothetical protein
VARAAAGHERPVGGGQPVAVTLAPGLVQAQEDIVVTVEDADGGKLPLMTFSAPPRQAAWEHRGARRGFEVVFVAADGGGWLLEGHTTAVEDGEAWAVRYALAVDSGWVTRSARVSGRAREVALEADGAGGWLVDGERAPELDGCLDVDLESSALTNALPVHRLRLAVGQAADAPAAYVRALDLGIERLEQRYERLPDDGGRQCFHYAAPRFAFECRLRYDEFGLVLEYPGLAVRAA